MTNIITPKILRGTRDFLPSEMAKRQYVLEKIKQVFVRFGYDTIETPAIEYLETLTGQYGEEGSKLIYNFKDRGGRQIALRYDQTVPMARVMAANYQELPMPFRRYQIGPVWRADRPAKGRYREFYQCDVDIIGTESLLADAEIAKIAFAVCIELGFSDFLIKWNSRRLINAILFALQIPEKKQTTVIRLLDKLEKIGREEGEKELSTVLSSEVSKKLLKIILQKGTLQERLKMAMKYDNSEVQKFTQLCTDFGIPERNLEFDMSLARGLDYYTGIIYEIVLPSVDIGSIGGGGRYDDLCSRFCTEKFSGVGIAFGFDRIITAMKEKGLLKNVGTVSQVLITYFDEQTLQNSLQILNVLQGENIPCEIYYEPEKLGKQLKYAAKKKIPFVLFCGQEEVKKEEVKIRMMKTGKEKIIPQNQLVSYFRGILPRQKKRPPFRERHWGPKTSAP